MQMENNGTVILLCNLTNHMAKDWLDGGYQVVMVDTQHEDSFKKDGLLITIGETIINASKHIHNFIKNENVVFVAGFPPCTDVAVSGAAHFKSKYEKDPHFQAKAALIAEQCRMIGEISGAPYFFENPISVFSSIFGKPSFTFNPNEYGGYLAENDIHPEFPDYIPARDAYPKKTCLWAGNGFVMPDKKPVPTITMENGYSDMHNKLGGKSLKTKNIRSATPRGFSRAVYLSNAPHLKD